MIAHKNIPIQLQNSLIKAYKNLEIGTPLDLTMADPLIDKEAVQQMQDALNKVKKQGRDSIWWRSPGQRRWVLC